MSVYDRLTKCDSGKTLNPLMHVFIYVTFIFSLAFVVGTGSAGVQDSVLYQGTQVVHGAALSVWGIVGLAAVSFHVSGLLIRGRLGVWLMHFAMYCGFFIWLWASLVYWNGDHYFQLIVGALPNLIFWVWYAWQWRRRYQNKRVAFV